MSGHKIISGMVIAGAIIAYALLLLHPVNLVTADLGRHLKNGQLFLENFKPLATNFYSYTNPDFQVENHHWGSGVLFYAFYSLGGFVGLQLILVLAALLAFGLVLTLAWRIGSPGGAALGALLALPLLAERTELRPEFFSYLLIAVSLIILCAFRNQRLSARTLLITLPLLAILWVNIHIYFFLAWILIGAFWLESLFTKHRLAARTLLITLMLSVLATRINPYGLSGTLAPFTIFTNYGYRVLENQTVWFLWHLLPHWILGFFGIVSVFAAGSLAWAGWRSRHLKDFPFAIVLIILSFACAGWLELRNFALFGLVLPLALAISAKHIFTHVARAGENILSIIAASFAALLLGLSLAGGVRLVFTKATPVGLGLVPGNNAAAQFFLDNHIAGPIFNNYDIGGYLIYYIFPKEKVFVDNRPEAYPAVFFTDTYVPMQENETKWQAEDGKYKFNAIVFGYRDATPWGQTFIQTRIKDPDWAPVFADGQIIILLRRNELNHPLISRSELPSSIFRVTPN